MSLISKSGISRRGFLGGGMAAAAATLLSACSGKKDKDAETKGATGEPQVLTDDSKIIDALDEYESVDTTLTAAYTWNLPVGTVPFYSQGSWSAAMFAPESAATPNSIGVFSLSSGSPVTLRSKPVSGAGYEFYDVRVGTGVFCWVEINYSSFAWSLYAQAFAEGQVSGDPQKIDHGNADWEPPMFSPYGACVIWQKMPNSSGSKSTSSSKCYQWSLVDGSKTTLYTSPGRFATHPRVSNDILTISPRVHEDEGTYYGMTALSLADSSHGQIDQLVLPAGVRPFEAAYLNDVFAFAIEASYDGAGRLGNMGTFIGREGGPFVYISREPAAGVCGKGTRFCLKTRSSTCVVDTDAQKYSVVACPDRSLDYGDYPASEGATDNLVTFATIKDAQGIPESVCVRVFSL